MGNWWIGRVDILSLSVASTFFYASIQLKTIEEELQACRLVLMSC